MSTSLSAAASRHLDPIPDGDPAAPAAPGSSASSPAEPFGAAALARMGHQFRSPLAAITSLTRIMLLKAATGPVDQAKLIRQLEMIQSSAHASLTTVERVLDGAKITSGTLGTDRRLVDCSAMVTEVAAMLGERARERGVLVGIDVPQRCATVTDPDAFGRLLSELIDNAVRYTDGDEVGVRLRTEPGRLLIDVSDGGPGITGPDQMRIFEAFERGDTAAERHAGGAGLGLYLARKLAGRLGAELAVSSRPGSGTTFTVSITRS